MWRDIFPKIPFYEEDPQIITQSIPYLPYSYTEMTYYYGPVIVTALHRIIVQCPVIDPKKEKRFEDSSIPMWSELIGIPR
ncbi:unnamed protein product [Allacma fusca]|uniref:Uncharacterized protein n=1 Tax=Allacma fusca TaxID=39272 RepID=A0A8J2JLX2_9HEXA|nr:unnamed protein product [Allacma fusca]